MPSLIPVAQMAALYGSGMTLVEVGRIAGHSGSHVRKLLKAAGVQMRKPGKPIIQDWAAVFAANEAGEPQRAIARRLGVTQGAIGQGLRNYRAERGLKATVRRGSVCKVDYAEARRMREAGSSYEEIGARFGVKPRSAAAAIYRTGGPAETPWKPRAAYGNGTTRRVIEVLSKAKRPMNSREIGEALGVTRYLVRLRILQLRELGAWIDTTPQGYVYVAAKSAAVHVKSVREATHAAR